jgi:hypothetical protein
MKQTIKGVGNDGYPILASALCLPRHHPLPIWCECGAVLPWLDLGVLQYEYPHRRWHVFICSACGKHTINFRVDKQ